MSYFTFFNVKKNREMTCFFLQKVKYDFKKVSVFVFNNVGIFLSENIKIELFCVKSDTEQFGCLKNGGFDRSAYRKIPLILSIHQKTSKSR